MRDDMRVITSEPLNAEPRLPALEDEITPTRLFFKRNHYPWPSSAVGAAAWESSVPDWRLQIVGGTDGLREVPLSDLVDDGEDFQCLLECAGNGRELMSPKPPGTAWGLGAVSNGRWRGCDLGPVLEAAGIPDDAVEVMFEGADGPLAGVEPQESPVPPLAKATSFARSLPLEVALRGDVRLVWGMNGGPLPLEHGGPLRLIVPNWYGVASVKWLSRIAFLSAPFDGYYQAEDYMVLSEDGEGRQVGRMRPRALITSPADGDTVGSSAKIVGWAWSGLGDVARVEVSTDDVTVEADLEPADARWAWRRFEAQVSLPPGTTDTVQLSARAVDAAGNRQPDDPVWNRLGYEHNPPHTITLQRANGDQQEAAG